MSREKTEPARRYKFRLGFSDGAIGRLQFEQDEDYTRGWAAGMEALKRAAAAWFEGRVEEP